MPLVRIERISKQYPSGTGFVHAVCDVSLAIEPGEFVAIRGRSGSGKSTLMNVLGLLEQPDCGTYVLKTRDVANLSEEDRASIRSGDIGFVFQLPALLPREIYEVSDRWTAYGDTLFRLTDRKGAEHLLAEVPGQAG